MTPGRSSVPPVAEARATAEGAALDATTTEPETLESATGAPLAATLDAETPAGLLAAPDPTAAAFFDVDNTIVRGASIYHLARGLYQRDFFSLRDIARFGMEQLRFMLLGENLEHVAEIQDRALSFVAGHSEAELRAIGAEVYDELMADKIWPGTQRLAQQHVAAGQRVWLVTATPVEVADVIANRLGLSGSLGTVAEHVDGIYTGKLVGPPMHGGAKADAVRALAAREGLDLARCSAYSDSSNDIPMLSLVGNPVAINPDGKLRSYARAHGWQVHDYRTGRRAAKIGLPVVAGTGLVAGAAVSAVLANRRRR